MHIKKLLFLLSLSVITTCSMQAGEHNNRDTQTEYERALALKWMANLATSGSLGKSVPIRIGGMIYLSWEASHLIMEKNQDKFRLSDLKLSSKKLPFYHTLKLDIRYLQEQYIKNLQMKLAAHNKSIKFILTNRSPIHIASKPNTTQKQPRPSKTVTIGFKKAEHQEEKRLPEELNFDVQSNPFDATNNIVKRALMSSRHLIVTNGINKGLMRKLK